MNARFCTRCGVPWRRDSDGAHVEPACRCPADDSSRQARRPRPLPGHVPARLDPDGTAEGQTSLVGEAVPGRHCFGPRPVDPSTLRHRHLASGTDTPLAPVKESIEHAEVDGVPYVPASDLARIVRRFADAPADKVRTGLRNLADALDRIGAP